MGLSGLLLLSIGSLSHALGSAANTGISEPDIPIIRWVGDLYPEDADHSQVAIYDIDRNAVESHIRVLNPSYTGDLDAGFIAAPFSDDDFNQTLMALPGRPAKPTGPFLDPKEHKYEYYCGLWSTGDKGDLKKLYHQLGEDFTGFYYMPPNQSNRTACENTSGLYLINALKDTQLIVGHATYRKLLAIGIKNCCSEDHGKKGSSSQAFWTDKAWWVAASYANCDHDPHTLPSYYNNDPTGGPNGMCTGCHGSKVDDCGSKESVQSIEPNGYIGADDLVVPDSEGSDDGATLRSDSKEDVDTADHVADHVVWVGEMTPGKGPQIIVGPDRKTVYGWVLELNPGYKGDLDAGFEENSRRNLLATDTSMKETIRPPRDPEGPFHFDSHAEYWCKGFSTGDEFSILDAARLFSDSWHWQTIQPHSCDRRWCDGTTGVYTCNTNDAVLYVRDSTMANFARTLRRNCCTTSKGRSGYALVDGHLWFTAIGYANCDDPKTTHPFHYADDPSFGPNGMCMGSPARESKRTGQEHGVVTPKRFARRNRTTTAAELTPVNPYGNKVPLERDILLVPGNMGSNGSAIDMRAGSSNSSAMHHWIGQIHPAGEMVGITAMSQEEVHQHIHSINPAYDGDFKAGFARALQRRDGVTARREPVNSNGPHSMPDPNNEGEYWCNGFSTGYDIDLSRLLLDFDGNHDYLVLPPSTCRRVACKNTSGVYICNTTPKHQADHAAVTWSIQTGAWLKLAWGATTCCSTSWAKAGYAYASPTVHDYFVAVGYANCRHAPTENPLGFDNDPTGGPNGWCLGGWDSA